MRIHAVVAAAGGGARFGGEKLRARLGRRRVVDYAQRPFAMHAGTNVSAVLVVPPGQAGQWRPRLPAGFSCQEVDGGAARAQSVRRGLDALRGAADAVLVHDAARPLLWAGVLQRLLACTGEDDGALLALPVTDTLKREDAGRAAATVARAGLWRAQTPQLYPFEALLDALAGAPCATDEAMAMEARGRRPRLVPGCADNIKITWPADLARAERILQEDPDRAYWSRL